MPKKREVTKALVEQWYHKRAQATFRERLALCQRRFSKPEDFEPAGLVIMQLRQRWGSMTPTGKLILNRVLIRASVDAIDYVITHEPVPYAPQSPRRGVLPSTRPRDAGLGKAKAQARMPTSIGQLRVGHPAPHA
jgi:hypothetical protein